MIKPTEITIDTNWGNLEKGTGVDDDAVYQVEVFKNGVKFLSSKGLFLRSASYNGSTTGGQVKLVLG